MLISRFVHLALAVGLSMGLFFAAVPARANGRYPLAQQLLVDPSDSSHLFLRSTYGVLTSPDAGATWSWLCEAGIGYDPGEDPMMAMLGDGTALAGASTGLFVTRDRGCSWPKDATLGGRYVRDLAAEPNGSGVLAVTLVVRQTGIYDSVVWRSSDGAQTWMPTGMAFSESFLPFTLDEAPSDPNRIYVTAALFGPGGDAGAPSSDASVAPSSGVSANAPGVLFRSRDGGVTWEERPIPGTTRENAPFIAAVHPTNPDIFYVRVQGAWDGKSNIQSWLLYTEDAGDTWKELFRASADMLGFALGAGGATVLVGMGDTHDVLRPVDTSVVGLYRATAPEFTFSQTRQGQVGCLTYSGANLYICGGEESDGFELAVSSDDGATATPVFHYGTVKGPLDCPKDTSQAMICAPAWGYSCQGLGSCAGVDAGIAPAKSGTNGGCCGTSTAGSNGSQIGTARSEMLPGAEGWLAVATAVLGGMLRRRTRKKNRA